jgi:DNA processing protein
LAQPPYLLARIDALEAADHALHRADRVAAVLLAHGDPALPAALSDLPDAPPVLWALGDCSLLSAQPCVAVVGTRRASAYGERITHALCGALARAGACIVSGMALGVDAVAHRAALEASGRTIAVLGTGVDLAYPTSHRALHDEIRRRGLVLSEHLPGCRANAGSFPRRNRIIAALGGLTIVVEAGRKSGALITATCAADLGRTVAAVPGCIDQPQSEGTNLLIRDGAHIITSIEDALALAGLTAPPRLPTFAAGCDEALVWEALADGELDVDSLCTRSRLPTSRCLAAITTLELQGTIECALTGQVRRRIG